MREDFLVSRNHGKGVSEIVQRIVDRRIAGREQDIEDRPGSKKKAARLDDKREALRQREPQSTGYSSLHEFFLPREMNGILLRTAFLCQENRRLTGWQRRCLPCTLACRSHKIQRRRRRRNSTLAWNSAYLIIWTAAV